MIKLFSNKALIATFSLLASGHLFAIIVRWTPDEQALTHAENPVGALKLWIRPLAGGPPEMLAEFGTDRVFGFGWSPDGKRLACVREHWAFNAVMIKDFK